MVIVRRVVRSSSQDRSGRWFVGDARQFVIFFSKIFFSNHDDDDDRVFVFVLRVVRWQHPVLMLLKLLKMVVLV